MPAQIKFDRFYLKQAADLGQEFSNALRLKVGVVITRDNRPVANGYNGTPEGWHSNICEAYEILCLFDDEWNPVSKEDYDKLEDPNNIYKRLVTKPEVIHGEANLIAYCARRGIATEGCTIYQNISPCMPCCVLMKAAGIKRIIYSENYRDTSAIDFCKATGISLEQIVL